MGCNFLSLVLADNSSIGWPRYASNTKKLLQRHIAEYKPLQMLLSSAASDRELVHLGEASMDSSLS